MPTQAAMGQPWNVSSWLPACQILARYDVNSALALHRGFLGSPPLPTSFYPTVIFSSSQGTPSLTRETWGLFMRTRPLGTIPPIASLLCRSETREAGSLRACSHAPESLHGDSSRVTGKQPTCDQDVSVFPSSAPVFSPAVAVARSG